MELTKKLVNASVNHLKTNALCDTGANVSCIILYYVPNILPNIYSSIKGVGGTIHKVSGTVEIDVSFGSVPFSHTFLVVEDLPHSLILGHDFSK